MSATADRMNMLFYTRRIGSRPRRERVELGATLAVTCMIFAALIAAGYGFELPVLWILLSRLAVLGWAGGSTGCPTTA